MRCLPAAMGLMTLALACSCAAPAPAMEAADDPIFDFDRIANEPLDAKVLKTAEEEGVVVEEVEYTAGLWNGKPVRIFGILAYPKGGTGLPAVFWSSGVMWLCLLAFLLVGKKERHRGALARRTIYFDFTFVRFHDRLAQVQP